MTTMDYIRGRHYTAAAAMLSMNKFTRNVHAAGHDVLTVLDDLRIETIIAHPALQMPGTGVIFVGIRTALVVVVVVVMLVLVYEY